MPSHNQQIEHGVPGRRVEGAPHTAIAGESRIHHQRVPDELEIGVVVGRIVQHDERIE